MALSEITGKIGQFEETGVAVADDIATKWTVDCNRQDQQVRFTVKNSHASVAFAEFAVAIRPTTNAAFVTHASTAGSFTTPVHPMVDASGSPVTLAAGASVSFAYDISGIDAIRIQIGGDGAASTADLYAGFGV